MSWSSDIRCLYCDGKLPLYRKITNGQFCSAPHRKLYWQEQERLGVERLHQTHDSLRAFRPPEGVESILGPAMAEAIPPARMYDEPAKTVAADPFSYEPDLSTLSALWAPQIACEEQIYADAEVEAPAPLAEILAYVPDMPQPRWPTDRMEMASPNALPPRASLRIPLRALALSTAMSFARLAKLPVSALDFLGGRQVEPIHPTPQVCRDIVLSAVPVGFDPQAIDAEAESMPRGEKLALPQFAAQDFATQTRRDPWPSAPFLVQRAYLPLMTGQCGFTLAMPVPAGMRPLSIDLVPLVHGTWIDSLRALGREVTESPRYELSTPALRPRLRLAAGSRYPVATRDQAPSVAAIEPENLPAANGVAIPERKAMAAAANSSTVKLAINIPAPAGLLPLVSAKPNDLITPAMAQSFNPPQPLLTAPMRPASHLEPLDAKPIADLMADPGVAPVAEEKKIQAENGAGLVPQPTEANAATPWMHVAGFWKHAPRDLKLLVFGIPILLALALHPSLKKIPYATPTEVGGVPRGIQKSFQGKLSERWMTVKQNMVERAAIALDEDFRAGLDDWTSRGGTTEWAFDATGFVRPGPLALYRPSIDLTDYQMQFLGMIDKKALSWVVRAADFDDYYVVKLVVLKPGPVPTIGVTRYAVIHGVAQDRADTIAFINAREDMLYRVRMDIHADTFALTVQGQLVDSWSEPRLRTGGVGFFTARGEASRLRWVQVTHQYDMLGRLCAYLAPYNIPSTNGGWQP
jgi:hypothetical protein